MLYLLRHCITIAVLGKEAGSMTALAPDESHGHTMTRDESAGDRSVYFRLHPSGWGMHFHVWR
ncbi:TPA: hypothetical protein EYG59_24240 [Candidatus Poribacteria bacterium]|nr:hypothetical protein [Candidatus Poribacteria bacterium]